MKYCDSIIWPQTCINGSSIIITLCYLQTVDFVLWYLQGYATVRNELCHNHIIQTPIKLMGSLGKLYEWNAIWTLNKSFGSKKKKGVMPFLHKFGFIYVYHFFFLEHYGIIILLSVTCSQMFLNCHPHWYDHERKAYRRDILLLSWTPFKYWVPYITMVPIVASPQYSHIFMGFCVNSCLKSTNDNPTVYSRGNWCLIDVDPRVFAI